MFKDKLINEFKKRWKYLLVAYVLGYISPLVSNGVPNIYYLIPLKIGAFFTAWTLGNVFYHVRTERPPVFKNLYYAVLYSISGAILCIILMIPVLAICMISGLSINTFIGVAH
jgi:hypothetical protein